MTKKISLGVILILAMLCFCTFASMGNCETVNPKEPKKSEKQKKPKKPVGFPKLDLHKHLKPGEASSFHTPFSIGDSTYVHGKDVYKVGKSSIVPCSETLPYTVCDFDKHSRRIFGIEGTTGIIAKYEKLAFSIVDEVEFMDWEYLEGIDRSKCKFRYFYRFFREEIPYDIWVITYNLSPKVDKMVFILSASVYSQLDSVVHTVNISRKLSVYLNHWIATTVQDKQFGICTIPMISEKISQQIQGNYQIWIPPMTLSKIVCREEIGLLGIVVHKPTYTDNWFVLLFQHENKMSSDGDVKYVKLGHLRYMRSVVFDCSQFDIWIHTEERITHFEGAALETGQDSFGIYLMVYSTFLRDKTNYVTTRIFEAIRLFENGQAIVFDYYSGIFFECASRNSAFGQFDANSLFSLSGYPNASITGFGITEPSKEPINGYLLFYISDSKKMCRVIDMNSGLLDQESVSVEKTIFGRNNTEGEGK